MVAQSRPEKLWFLDNLKTALTTLVIVHHVGQGYGPGGWWYFQSPERLSWLKLLFVLNRSFFMSLFFMISGYLLYRSLSGKTQLWPFVRDRLTRFGKPLLIFGLGVFPVLLYAFHRSKGDIGDVNFFFYYVRFYLGIGTAKPAVWAGASWPDLQLGHLWFIQHLLILSLLAAFLKKMGILRFAPVAATFRPSVTIFLLLLISAVTFAVRTVSPIDRWVGLLGFIQIAYADVPRDLFFFALGILSFRTRLIEQSRPGAWKWHLILALVLGLVYAMILFSPPLHALTIESPWWPLAFPFWESFYCYSMCRGLVCLFRERLNKTTPFLSVLGNLSYRAYLIHVPVIVFIQYILKNASIPLSLTFVLASMAGVISTYALSHLVDSGKKTLSLVRLSIIAGLMVLRPGPAEASTQTSFTSSTGWELKKPYSFGIEQTLGFTLKKPLLQTSHSLMEDNAVTIGQQTALTPVSVSQKLGVSLTPIAFLKFGGSVLVGSGWEALGCLGTGVMDSAGRTFRSGFVTRSEIYGQIQIETKGILRSERLNFQALMQQRLTHRHFSNASNNQHWIFQDDAGENLNGWTWSTSWFGGYAYPLKGDRELTLGALVQTNRLLTHYDSSPSSQNGWGSDFVNIDLNPLAKVKVNGALEVIFLATIRKTRFFEDTGAEIPLSQRRYAGAAWGYDRVQGQINVRFGRRNWE